MNIRVGYFGKPHGLRGELRFNVFSETGWKPVRGAHIESVNKKSERASYTILEIRTHKNFYLVTCSGIATRDEAQLLAGCEVRAHIEKLPEHAFLIKDLLGSSVKSIDGRYLGTVAQILPTGSNDIYCVVHEGREILIPALKRFVRKFDKETKELLVDLPDGLEPWLPKHD